MLQFTIRRLIIIISMMGVMSVVSFAIIAAPPGDNLSTQLAQLEMLGGSAGLICRLTRCEPSTAWTGRSTSST